MLWMGICVLACGCVCLCMCVFMCVSVFMSLCVCVFVCVYIFVYVWVYVHIYVHMHGVHCCVCLANLYFKNLAILIFFFSSVNNLFHLKTLYWTKIKKNSHVFFSPKILFLSLMKNLFSEQNRYKTLFCLKK